MRFAKRVFVIAGAWGLLIVPPMFFVRTEFERQYRQSIRTRSSTTVLPGSRPYGSSHSS